MNESPAQPGTVSAAMREKETKQRTRAETLSPNSNLLSSFLLNFHGFGANIPLFTDPLPFAADTLATVRSAVAKRLPIVTGDDALFAYEFGFGSGVLVGLSGERRTMARREGEKGGEGRGK